MKGLLLHLEHMSSSLQMQTAEDKIRLRQENERLVAMQASLDKERSLHNERCQEELAIIRARMKDIEAEQRQLVESKRKHLDECQEREKNLELNRREFKQLMDEQTRSADTTIRRLVDEEERIKKLRSDANDELNQLIQSRLTVSSTIAFFRHDDLF